MSSNTEPRRARVIQKKVVEVAGLRTHPLLREDFVSSCSRSRTSVFSVFLGFVFGIQAQRLLQDFASAHFAGMGKAIPATIQMRTHRSFCLQFPWEVRANPSPSPRRVQRQAPIECERSQTRKYASSPRRTAGGQLRETLAPLEACRRRGFVLLWGWYPTDVANSIGTTQLCYPFEARAFSPHVRALKLRRRAFL